METLIDKIGRFNERYAARENEKAVFSVEYAEFRWSEPKNAGCFIANRYGLVSMARDLMCTAAASGPGSSGYATKFEEGSDDIIILKKRPAHGTDHEVRMSWKEALISGLSDEGLYLESILEMTNGVLGSFPEEEAEPAKIEWNRHNRAAFVKGTAFGLVLLAREFVQFALSASPEDSYETAPLHEDGGRLVLVLRDEM